MAQLIPNSFSTYALTDREVLEGSIFNTLQTQVLQNHLAGIAEEKLNLEIDPTFSSSYLQQEAALSDKIKFLQYLLDTSLTSQDLLKQSPNGEL